MKIELVEKKKEDIKALLNCKADNVEEKMHQIYLVNKYQMAEQRQGTANAKTRGEVRGGGAKPYRQKGTGHARRGTNRTPLRRGGGVIFGPKYRTYDSKINKKVISDTCKAVLLNSPVYTLPLQTNELKTKDLRHVFNNRDKFCVIVDSTSDGVYLPCRNFKNIYIIHHQQIDINAVLCSDKIVISDEAWQKLEEINKNG